MGIIGKNALLYRNAKLGHFPLISFLSEAIEQKFTVSSYNLVEL